MLGVTLGAPLRRAGGRHALHAQCLGAHCRRQHHHLLSARSEMGQGVYTSMPMLIAEELNVDIRKVKVAIAPPTPRFTPTRLLGAQITGGSTSVRDGWDKLRIAGAQVREMLVSAALRAGTSTATLKAEQRHGHRPEWQEGDLRCWPRRLPHAGAREAALKDPKDFRIIGKRTRGSTRPMKVNGTAEFGIDVKLPGMVYASLEQCPVIGGKVKSFDASKAKGMPGVIDVVQIPDGVAVVADSYWHANKARQALTVQWDDGPGRGHRQCQHAGGHPQGGRQRQGDGDRAAQGRRGGRDEGRGQNA
jgi:isoquinoline 1-oxidoreductase beta subunit